MACFDDGLVSDTVQSGSWREGRRMPLAVFCETYIRTNPSLKSGESARLLRISCAHYSAYLGHPAWVSEFTDENLAAYIRHRTAMGRRPATVEREAAKLLTLWRAAALRGLVSAPIIRIAKAHPDVPQAMLKSEIRRVFRACAKAKGLIGNVAAAIYFLALFGVLWETSERIGAMLCLERADVAFIGDWWIRGAWVTFRVRKGGAPPTKKRVSGWTARRLWQLMKAHDAAKLFGYVNRSSIYKPARNIYWEAGVGFGRNVFHGWRKSHASHVRRLGGDATAALGHSDKRVTDAHYIDPKVCPAPQSVDLLFSPVSFLDRLLGIVWR